MDEMRDVWNKKETMMNANDHNSTIESLTSNSNWILRKCLPYMQQQNQALLVYLFSWKPFILLEQNPLWSDLVFICIDGLLLVLTIEFEAASKEKKNTQHFGEQAIIKMRVRKKEHTKKEMI